jgi:thiamine-phosphate pyrophosphorylase
VLQYRDKHSPVGQRVQQAGALQSLCHEHGAIFIINDDVELARQCRADGVHLGQDDNNIAQARDYLGNQAIIGASCYNQLDLARLAHSLGASYLAFGRFFPSSTKPDAVQAELEILVQAKALRLPICAIGGITQENAASLINAGADLIAVVEGVFGQPDIRKAASKLASLF